MTSQIPSYIIKERTGMTPRQYQDKRVMKKLGIAEDKYDWLQNHDGVESSFHGLFLTPMQMAKFGQLYLQGGRASPSDDKRVISQEFIDASFTRQVTINDNDPFAAASGLGGTAYGYLWGGRYESPSRPVYCAEGQLGQIVCVDRDLGRVVVQQRDDGPNGTPPKDWTTVLDFFFENSLSFRTTNGGLSGMSSTVESRAE